MNDNEPTAVRDESPVMSLIRDVANLTTKVDQLTSLVTKALNYRLADDAAYKLARQCARRVDNLEEHCAHTHPQKRPTNGSSHEL